MAAPTHLKKGAAAGLRYVQFGLVNTDGNFIGTGLPAQGASVGMSNAKGFTDFALDVPDPVRHNVVGRSGADKWTFQFAAEENPSGSITSKMLDMELRALLTGIPIVEVGDLQTQGAATDQDGSEPQSLVLVSEYGSSEAGIAMLVHELVSLAKFSAKAFPMATGATESDHVYPFITNQAAKTPWGKAFSAATDGFTKAASMILTSENMISMHAYVADAGTPEEFTLDYLPAGDETSDKIKLFKASDGSAVTLTDVDTTTGVCQFGTAVADDLYVCVYEIASGQIT